MISSEAKELMARTLENSRGPASSAPWASVIGAEEYSTPDQRRRLSKYSGELAWLTRIRAWNPETEEEQHVLLSSHGYHAGEGGDGASEGIDDFRLFVPGLSNPGSLKASIVSGGKVKAGATPSHGNITLANADGRFDYLLELHYRDRPYDQWVGEARHMGPRFADFSKSRTGRIEDVTWDAKSIKWSVRDPKDFFQGDINPDSYLGFGTAIRSRASGDGATMSASPDFHPKSLHVRVMVQLEALRNCVVLNYGWEESSREGWEMRILADGSVLWVEDDYAVTLVTEGDLIKVGSPHRVSFEGGSYGRKIYVDGVLRASTQDAYTPSPLIDASSVALLVCKRSSF